MQIPPNTAAAQSGGAGITAAQLVAEQEAEAVITGNLGPNASNVLKQFKIKAYHASGIISQVVDKFIRGNR